jgi:hypothetical protein
MANKNNNDVVIIELDKPRELRFGHKALKKMSASTGKSVEDMESEMDFEELEQIFLYGLEKDARANGETLTLDMMEDILDCAPSYQYLMDKFQEAIKIAMGSMVTEGNAMEAPKLNRAGRRAK